MPLEIPNDIFKQDLDELESFVKNEDKHRLENLIAIKALFRKLEALESSSTHEKLFQKSIEVHGSNFIAAIKVLKEKSIELQARKLIQGSNFEKDNNVRQNIDNITDEIISGGNGISGLVNIIQYIRSENFESQQIEFSENAKQANELFKELKKKASEVFFEDYAEVYERQARHHANMPSRKNLRLGLSQFWLFCGLAILGWLIFYTIQDKGLLGIQSQSPEDFQEYVIVLLKKSLLLGLFFFSIRFCFRQYRIHQHLFTVNHDRANALKSFKLFANSIDKDHSDIRESLTVEMAKHVYSNQNSGHLNRNENDGPSFNLVELTKIINSKNQ